MTTAEATLYATLGTGALVLVVVVLVLVVLGHVAGRRSRRRARAELRAAHLYAQDDTGSLELGPRGQVRYAPARVPVPRPPAPAPYLPPPLGPIGRPPR